MLSVRKPSWMFAAGVVGLLTMGGVATAQAGSAVEWGDFGSSPSDSLTSSRLEAGNKYVLAASSISIDDIEELQAAQKRDSTEIQSLKSTIDKLQDQVDDLKRSVETLNNKVK